MGGEDRLVGPGQDVALGGARLALGDLGEELRDTSSGFAARVTTMRSRGASSSSSRTIARTCPKRSRSREVAPSGIGPRTTARTQAPAA